MLQSLAKQLHTEDIEVRAAAGEAIALLYHSCGISDLESFLEDQEQSDQESLSPPSSPIVAQNPGCQFNSQEQPQSRTSLLAADDTQNEVHSQAQNSAQSPGPRIDSNKTAGPSRVDQAGLASQSSSTITPDVASGRSEFESNADLPSSSASRASDHPADSVHVRSHANGETSNGDLANDDSPATVSEHHQNQSHDAKVAASQQQVSSSNPHASAPDFQNSAKSAGNRNSDQQPGKSKGGQQAKSHGAARNPKQQAAAISNGLDDVVSRMKELATNRGDRNRRSRKERASMRSTFRELCNVVEVTFRACLEF